MANRKVILPSGKVYEESGERKVVVTGSIYTEDIVEAPTGFQAAWAHYRNIIIQGNQA